MKFDTCVRETIQEEVPSTPNRIFYNTILTWPWAMIWDSILSSSWDPFPPPLLRTLQVESTKWISIVFHHQRRSCIIPNDTSLISSPSHRQQCWCCRATSEGFLILRMKKETRFDFHFLLNHKSVTPRNQSS